MRYAARYDDLLRLTRVSYTRVSDGATLFAESRGFDAAGNVVGLTTTLPAGTDTQALCYDVQNRLTWASSASGSIPCGGTNTAGTLTAAQYTQSFSYDTLGRLVSGPLGPYTYGTGMQTASQTPLHAAQYIGTPGQLSPPPVPGASHARARQSSADASASADASLPGAPGALPSPGSAPPYSALYNSNGEMTCRSTSTTLSASCYGGNNGGAQMGYDAEGQLVHWQNAPGGSGSTLGSGGYTTSVNVLYDGEGNRVEQQLAQFSCGQACGTTYTTTQYVAMGIEEVTLGSSGTTTTKYYPTGTLVTAVRVNGTLAYLAADGLGSISAALSSGGTLTAAQLFAPYGGVRYSSRTMPTARGFTGQYADVTTGLDYYGARYYDAVAGQFTSADSVLPGKGYGRADTDRYAYVTGDPETLVDPSGHKYAPGNPGNGAPPPPPPNNDGWVDYSAEIAAHRNDGDLRGPWVDTRWHTPPQAADSSHRRAYAQEQADAYVLMNYFGLTVEWQSDYNPPQVKGGTADYMIGLDKGSQLHIGPIPIGPTVYTSDFDEVAYGTPVDLYYPAQSSPENAADKARQKHSQAPIVVVDISDDPALQAYSSAELQKWAAGVMHSPGVIQVRIG